MSGMAGHPVDQLIAQDAKIGVGTAGWLSNICWLQGRQDELFEGLVGRCLDRLTCAEQGIKDAWAHQLRHIAGEHGIPRVWREYGDGEWGTV